ncbi:Serine/threonine-protein phosphatase 1 regulatory subunit 10 [Rhynchospora pubera]|uniref:Serine/threonine-protein phosphatase 1 regulatory subunit 10 n=1 Tax=Rhynchospora pubera TaxID=906938 RepID=A0AAV8E3K1_9POAL|nr:Serine/threonine-protein phosphatase 1 regulatory subunit 10 [Rhynchospora pubera]
MTSNNSTPMLLDHTHLVLSQAEITDGITTINRFEEIVSAIAKANPDTSKGNPNPNSNGVFTHWCSLVHAIAATSDEVCIRHFVDKLNGLGLITEWAHLAQKLSNEVTIADVSDGASDKLIVSMLNLLKRLPTETCMLADGGILSVLKELGMSKSSIIKEMASALHDKWRPTEVGSGSSSHHIDSTIPDISESVKDEPQKPDISTKLDVSDSPMKGKTVEEEEDEEEEEEERMKSSSDPISPAYSSDTDSMPDVNTVVSPTEKEKKKVETVYDDDMDALEIARQVAIQVEEEVVQYRETLCSSPEEETKQVDVDLPTESIEAKTDKKTVDRILSIPSLREEDSALTTGHHKENQVKDSKADGSGLDLNENLCLDNETIPELIHVAASKGVPPSSSMPVSSFRFDSGTSVGWTGTAAATSAFRPASPRSGLNPSVDRSSRGTPGLADSVSQKRKSSSCLAFEFDLNVAETNEVNLRPSGDSSTEVSSERAKKLKLDLNCSNEDEVVEPIPAQQPPKQVLSHVVRDHGHSSASSSSLRNQAKFDFDLNDDPSSCKDEGQNVNSAKSMGWNLMDNTDPRTQTTPPIFHSFLGPNATSSQFGSLAGPSSLYQTHLLPPPSGFGYQYNATPQVWYGQPSTSYAVPPPFAQHMVGPVTENGPSVGLSLMSGDRSNFFRPSLDLNAGTGSVEATTREVGFRQFIVQNHSGSVQEPAINATAQQAVQSPGNGVRWREQDRGRETFSFGFKQLI